MPRRQRARTSIPRGASRSTRRQSTEATPCEVPADATGALPAPVCIERSAPGRVGGAGHAAHRRPTHAPASLSPVTDCDITTSNSQLVASYCCAAAAASTALRVRALSTAPRASAALLCLRHASGRLFQEPPFPSCELRQQRLRSCQLLAALGAAAPAGECDDCGEPPLHASCARSEGVRAAGCVACLLLPTAAPAGLLLLGPGTADINGPG